MHLLVVHSTPAQREIIRAAGGNPGIRVSFIDAGAVADALAAANPPERHPPAGDAATTALLVNAAAAPGAALALLRQLGSDAQHAGLHTALITPAQPGPALAQLIEAGLDLGARYFIADGSPLAAMQALLDALCADATPTRAEASGWRRLRGAWLLLRRIDDVQELATLIAAVTPEPQRAVFGIGELLLNAIEHGNLGLSYEDKKRLRLFGGWTEEMRRRAELAENRDKCVRVSVRRTPAQISIRVSDDGRGFNWRPFLTLDARRACDPNGRGIAMARLTSFNSVDYVGDGHVVVATIADTPTAEEATA